MSSRKLGTDLISRRSFLGALGTFAAAAPFSLWPFQSHAFFNTGAFMKKRRGNGQTSNGYTIGQSLRFNSATPAYLKWTPAAASVDQKRWTFSSWVKLSAFGTYRTIWYAWDSTGTGTDLIRFENTDQIAIQVATPATSNYYTYKTNAVFRDPSAWYHIVVTIDTPNATAEERIRLYVNGTRTYFSSAVAVPANFVTYGGVSAIEHDIGGSKAQYPLEGYLSEIYFIDGQALDATYFGQTDTVTGQWIPKKYAGTYGTNGFYLPVSSATAVNGSGTKSGGTLAGLGADFSGNNNHWSGSGLNTYDQVLDSPTNNFCTWNGACKGSTVSLSNGSLSSSHGAFSTGASNGAFGTIAVASGKWYWEIKITAISSGTPYIGIVRTDQIILTDTGHFPNQSAGYAYRHTGERRNNNTDVAYGSSFTAGDTIGIALDLDTGTLTFYKGNTSQGQAYSGLSGLFVPASANGTSGGSYNESVNFGQAAFANTTAWTALQSVGFKALCTANLPAPTIKNPSQYFNAVTYTGNGIGGASTQTISGVGHSPDLIWIKSRSGTYDHWIQDSVRGLSVGLSSDRTDGDITSAGGDVGSVNADGFGLLSNNVRTNLNGTTYVAWCWKKGTLPGFDIVAFSHTSGTGEVINHSCGATPSMIVAFTRNVTSGGWVWHKSLTSTNYGLNINSTGAQWNQGSSLWNPTSTTITANSGYTTANIVAYCWAEVPGFSKFGSYTANNSSDGPFLWCGFKPRWVMLKAATGSNTFYSWFIYDTVRETINPMSNVLLAESSSTPSTINGGYLYFDILANGFKPRTGGASNNGTDTYIFAAFAEAPFKYATAR